MRDFDINAAYLERKANAILGLRGSGTLAQYSQVQGLITLESDRPEWKLAGGETLWGIGRQIAAVAGQQSFVGVHVGPNSGILSVVERVTVAIAVAGAVLITVNFPDQAQPGDGIVFPRDLRFALAGQIPGTRRFEGTSAAPLVGSVVRRVSLLPSTTIVVEGPWILPPNSELGAFTAGQNVTIDASFEGYERPIEGKFEIK